MREIIVAEHAGFCFGVRRAVETAAQLLARKNVRVFALGHLIHNPQVLSDLAARGLVTVSEADIPAVVASATAETPAVLLIRAHGITRELDEILAKHSLENPAFSVADCTCPYVKNIHQTVDAHTTPDSVLIVIGDPSHPEVRGICAYAHGEVAVFDEPEAILSHQFEQKKAIVVAQTTQNLRKWEKAKEILQKRFTNIIFYATICGTTERRQTETAELARRVDMMLCIGGRESSNTRKLYEIAKAVQPRTYFVEGLTDLPDVAPTEICRIGITAGASTPSQIIQEVVSRMEEQQYTQEEMMAMIEGTLQRVAKNSIVEGTIVAVDAKGITLSIPGAKGTGFIAADEIVEPQAEWAELYPIGATIKAKITEKSDKDGTITLSKKSVDAGAAWEAVQKACEEHTILEVQVVKAIKGGLSAQYKGTGIFIPASQSGIRIGGDLSVLVGTTQKVYITEATDGSRRRAVGSIRAVLAEEKKAKAAEIWASLEEGQVLTGTVRNLESYGAFVDLGGVDGLVHITELSWSRIKHPSEVVSIGDTLTVYIKQIDAEKRKISLGYKTEENNPWNIFLAQYGVDSVASVKIVSLTAYGAFAQIIPGVDGLIHISQIADRKLAHPGDVLKVGDVVDAKIIEINEDDRRISLSVRALAEPAAEAEVVADDTTDAE